MKQISNDVNILYEDNHIIVCLKPEGLLSQQDETNDLDILTIIKAYLKEEYQKPGNVYLGLVHRLDRRVSGVMVFAKTSKAASRLSEQIRNHSFKKKYLAICSGHLEGAGTLKNTLKKESKEIKDAALKEAILNYKVIDYLNLDNKEFTIVDVDLKTGRYNQVRKQFSLINHPLINDFKYDYHGKNYNDHIGLFCVELGFNHPISKEFINFEYQKIKSFSYDNWKEYFGEKICEEK